MIVSSEIIERSGRHFIEVERVARGRRRDGGCPRCGDRPHGTAEITTSVAYGEVKANTLFYVGETESDDVWNNQRTLSLRGLPVLECSSCKTLYTNVNVTESR